MSKPYIGITGFKTPAQAISLLNAITSSEQDFFTKNNYQLMLGVTVSDKRLKDLTSEGKTSPNIGAIKSIFHPPAMTSFCLPMIHYFTSNPQNLSDEVVHLFKSDVFGSLYDTNTCRAIQLNQDWPSVHSLRQMKQRLPELLIVMQLSPNALKDSDEKVIAEAAKYVGLVDYILIDPSGGNAIALDQSRGTRLLNQLRDVLPGTHIGAAGGFGPDNIEAAVQQLGSGSYKRLCVDAQGKLRTDEQLDPAKANKYITSAISGFSKIT